jgi:hypothetical protein
MMENKKDVVTNTMAAWEETEFYILLEQATGGYHIRQMIKMTDGEIRDRIKKEKGTIMSERLGVRVAEAVLEEHGLSKEYEERARATIKDLEERVEKKYGKKKSV